MGDSISIIFNEVQEVMGTVNKQVESAQNMSNMLKNTMGPITGGSWTGQGAEAFTNEIMTKYLPEVMALIASIGGFGGNIGGALDIFDQADGSAASMVSGVVDSIGGLF